MPKLAVLLVNLGTPDSPTVPAVRNYLDEFLMDPRVIDYPAILRWLIVKGIILPLRPKRSAAKYLSVWTPEGSPLMVYSLALQRALAAQLDIPVVLGMRYGQPSQENAVRELVRLGVEEVLLVPLYPHYAMSTYESVVVKHREAIAAVAPAMRTTVLQPFFADADYIAALHESAKPALARPYDHLLISFHGIPRRHLLRGDPSKAHCQQVPDCCHQCSPVHATCYRAQTQQTALALARRIGVPDGRWSVSYQSRLGREVWLEPYTEDTLAKLARDGVKKLLVITPAFVADCLETLEEIRLEGEEIFHAAGGVDFEHIACLNAHPAWVELLAARTRRWRDSTPPFPGAVRLPPPAVAAP